MDIQEVIKKYGFELHESSSASDEGYKDYYRSYYNNDYMIRVFKDKTFEFFVKESGCSCWNEMHIINNEEKIKDFLNVVLP